MRRPALRLSGPLHALGAALVALAGTGCQPPDGVYDLVGNVDEGCGSGSVAEFADDFDDDSKASVWAGYANDSASIAEVNGQVEMRVDGSLKAFAGYTWLGGARSLLGCHVSVQMKQVASTAGGIVTYLSVPSDAGTEDGDIAFTQVGSSLTMAVSAGGAASSQVIPYDEGELAWWRIREADGVVHFETSRDGLSWLPQFSAETPGFAGAVSVNVGMGAPEPTSGAGFAIIDNLNVVP